jgi:hypothetical protein
LRRKACIDLRRASYALLTAVAFMLKSKFLNADMGHYRPVQEILQGVQKKLDTTVLRPYSATQQHTTTHHNIGAASMYADPSDLDAADEAQRQFEEEQQFIETQKLFADRFGDALFSMMVAINRSKAQEARNGL